MMSSGVVSCRNGWIIEMYSSGLSHLCLELLNRPPVLNNSICSMPEIAEEYDRLRV